MLQRTQNAPENTQSSASIFNLLISTVPQNLRVEQLFDCNPKVAVEQLADALVVLQSVVVVVAVGRGQVDESAQSQWQCEAVPLQEVGRRQRGEVEVGHVAQTGERIACQEGLCPETGSDISQRQEVTLSEVRTKQEFVSHFKTIISISSWNVNVRAEIQDENVKYRV